MLVALVAVLVVGLAVLVIGRGGSKDHSSNGKLPAVEGTTPPIDYRIVYRTTTPDGVGSEEHVVHRPFDAAITVRDADGKVTSERWSSLGRLVTRSQGAQAVRIDTAIAPAAGDVRPDLFSARLVEAKKLVAHTDAEQIGGRACTFASEAGEISTTQDSGQAASKDGQVKVLVSRCVDAQGLVLEERWTTTTGDRVLTKTAVELQLGHDVPKAPAPDAAPLPDAQGNGAVHQVDDHAVPPFAEAFELPTPDGFTFVGRYAVAPARLSASAGAVADADLALYTDVWRRGADVLLLDQGATKGGAPPFDPDTRVGDVPIGALGTAELALDLRSAELRLTRPDSGFVRLSGTIAPDELARIAGTLQVLQEAPR